jgi:hypothetical protein
MKAARKTARKRRMLKRRKGDTMKKLLVATAALLLSTVAYAGEIQIPSNRPIISTNVPDD